MTKTEPNQAAFAYFNEMNSWQTGLTKREYFALHILNGLMSNDNSSEYDMEELTSGAVGIADALIKKLNETK
jgi:hypothetical protein